LTLYPNSGRNTCIGFEKIAFVALTRFARSLRVHRVLFRLASLASKLGYKVFASFSRQRLRQGAFSPFRFTPGVQARCLVTPFALFHTAQSQLHCGSISLRYATLHLNQSHRTAAYLFCSPAESRQLRGFALICPLALRAAWQGKTPCVVCPRAMPSRAT